MSRPPQSGANLRRGSLAAVLAVAGLAAVAAAPPSAQDFWQSFKVSPSSTLDLKNRDGTIRVKGRRKINSIVISAKITSGDARVVAERAPDGTIQVDAKGPGTVNFDIEVPESTNLKLLSFRGSMHISHSSGAIKASILTDGSIELIDLQSPSVEAHSANGNVVFKGAVLPTGRYALKTFSGSVEATLPASSDFKLVAKSVQGGMDLGKFPLNFGKRTNQVVEGICGAGGASVSLWTQEGVIRLRSEP
jgi:DUF4097 and DUF4098 domain-containing protein YvlB